MNSIGIYTYNYTFYTGTQDQPDTLSIFIKKGKDTNDSFLVCHLEPVANLLGKCIPVVGSCTGIVRIKDSVTEIFKLLRRERSECLPLWDSFKNLVRGIAELLPFSGIFLIIYDATRNNVVIHSRITKAIQKQENIAGVAKDGDVICTIDLTQLERVLNFVGKSDEERLALFKALCIKALKNEQKKQEKQKIRPQKMTDIFLTLRRKAILQGEAILQARQKELYASVAD